MRSNNPLLAAIAMMAIASTVCPACLGEPATRPVTQPATPPKPDAPTDWLLGQATAAPSAPKDADGHPARATSGPASPFEPVGSNTPADKASRRGVIMLSNGEKIRGKFATTPRKPLRIYDEHEVFRDVPFELVKSAEAKVLWERDEKEWHFKESGSDIKEYSGKTYPARETQYALTLVNGQTLTGAIVAPLYLQTRDGQSAFVLHKRDKGEPGQTLKQLVYVQKVDFEDGPAGEK